MKSTRYRNLMIATRPLGLWPCDERAASATLTDISGSGLHMTIRASGSSADDPGGRPGGGLGGQKNGTNVGWENADTRLRLTSGFTFGGWFKSAAFGSDKGLIANWDGTGYMIMGTDTVIKAYRAGVAVTITEDIADGIWHRVSYSVDASGNRKVYKDGKVVLADSVVVSVPDTNFTIGFYNSASDNGFMIGSVAWVGYWERVLTAAEEAKLYFAGRP